MESALKGLAKKLEGELYWDDTLRKLYATDASAYREMPLAVALPKTKADIQALIAFANEQGTNLIPRTAGTSLAGQVVGSGIVVDVSKHFNKVLEVNEKENWVTVHPGVIRDDLNRHLKPYGLYFGPETSTANRAMIGGMVGNNSCGSNSVVYGSTREHLIAVTGYLSDGSEVTFSSLSANEFEEKLKLQTLEGEVYRNVQKMLSSQAHRAEIEREFPKPSIPRRNTGYAIDLLAINQPFKEDGEPFNFCKLVAGSEGTLMFITEIKVGTIPLPPKNKALVCIHCNDVNESLLANLVALKYGPHACELIDHYILECTKENIEQQKNRFFIQGDPGAILVVELAADNDENLDNLVLDLISDLKKEKLGYHFPVLKGSDIGKIWNLRKAGLGLLANIPGDAKAQPVIEDTAVDVNDLPAYIKEFNETLDKYNMSCVHYAHAGSGELHLRPILNLKTEEGHKMFRVVAEEISKLVKKYKGSLSGEHGDGRLRGEFIKEQIGEKNYELLKEVKQTWDPKDIFNPGKITDTPPMDSCLRYTADQKDDEIKTYFNWDKNQGVLRSAELCNGSGDCRKSAGSGGTMCPSYMATQNEKDTTRARANILREILTNSDKANKFDNEEIKEVLDLCLSCKGCKSECPSNVDMARLKAEFQQNYYDANGLPIQTRMMGEFATNMKLASKVPALYNFVFGNKLTGGIAKAVMGVHQDRSMPPIASRTMSSWYDQKKGKFLSRQSDKKVYVFCDEFTNYLDAEIGIKAIKLLDKLGYNVIIPEHKESGRALISKGMVKKAKNIADQNVELLAHLVSNDVPLVGIEPSTILTIRDEYPDLVNDQWREKAKSLADASMTIEEFLARETRRGNIKKEKFSRVQRNLKVHGHCHQKALSSIQTLKDTLSIPENYKVEVIPSGCCGMAGSFGYEKNHYDVSMKVGELVLFPTVRKAPSDTIIAAPGTSCRHQIKDGTGKVAKHPVEVLWDALV
ncbi:MAG: FAD-linked oxidase C-terminal domain-containing protein [Reichenbachiella sp.]|uniref:FAD-binding and (Fe-S)-binding domain-containing protein n=1 Tax=Reichenbachiella sp. TaxID=2184521 RepID=UPI002967191B|nr:FAD-linked oxidase C-terminal domain-containing protein [Reichenbachiella sp.]MDW3208705.1 FAD-linked oxidase C-terminal domain-containing protein [Reichenbachiella sp.]